KEFVYRHSGDASFQNLACSFIFNSNACKIEIRRIGRLTVFEKLISSANDIETAGKSRIQTESPQVTDSPGLTVHKPLANAASTHASDTAIFVRQDRLFQLTGHFGIHKIVG